jgi:hypothetical protein
MVTISKILLVLLLCSFAFIASLELGRAYLEHRAKELALEEEVRRRLAPGYKQRNMLRIINPGPHDIETLRIDYDGNSVEVHNFKSGYMFRHLVVTGCPAREEFIYSYVDGSEYRVKKGGFRSPDSEIAYALEGGEIHGASLGPIDANEKIGLSPVRSLTMRFHIAEQKGAFPPLELVECPVDDIRSDLKEKFDFEFPTESKELKIAKVVIIEGLTAFIAKFSISSNLLDEFLSSLPNTDFTPYDPKNDPRTYTTLPIPDWFKQVSIQQGKLGHFGSAEKGIHYIIDMSDEDKYVVYLTGSY